jgi:transglutaminase-like putative cysteine protease
VTTTAPADHRTVDVVQVAAEVALCLVTVSIALGFTRLFASSAFIPGLLVNVVAAHLVVAVARRRGWRAPVAVAAIVVSAVLIISWVGLGHALTYGVPTLQTWNEARAQLADAFAPFQRLIAPVPLTPGFELTMAIVVWVLAGFSDVAAFRGRAPVQAVIPHLGVLFATSVFARGRGSIVAAAAFGAAVALHLAAQRAWRSSQHRWIRGDGQRGPLASVAVAVVLACVAGLLALVVGPATPGARSSALVDLRAIGRGAGPLEVGNPLVGVSNLLGALSDVTVFTVRSPAAHYWRLTTLEEFDGKDQEWKTQRSYDEVSAGEQLPSNMPIAVPTVSQSATFSVSNLGGVWLPAAFEASRVQADIDVRWDRDSSSLIAAGESTLPQATYTVTSRIPVVDGASLDRRANRQASVDPVYLATPDVSPALADTARSLVQTAGAQTAYDKAIALQDYFRAFTYRTDVDYSKAADPSKAFLEAREGFCQQFASAFALMARVLGIPSRVAVGFSYGDADARPDADGLTTFTVKGRHAHAWPELYIPGAGWLPFEPTPTRGNPDAASYTNVAAAQAPPATDQQAVTTTTEDSRHPTATQPDSSRLQIAEDKPQARATTTSSGDTNAWALAGVALVGLGVLLVLGRAWWAIVRRRRRRGHRDTAAHRVRAAWVESCDWLDMMSIRPSTSETHHEFASRVAVSRDLDGEVDLGPLADLETERIFGDGALDPSDADAAEHVAASVRTAVLARTDRRRRVAATVGWQRRDDVESRN